MAHILVFTRDVGGTKGLLAVTNLLSESHRIEWFSEEGRGKDVLSSNGVTSSSIDDIYVLKDKTPEMVLSSTCSAIGRKAIQIFNGRCRSVVVQDQWGAGLKDWPVRPDYVLVNDEVDGEIILKAWPDYKSFQVIISGYSAFDSYHNFDSVSSRAKIGSLLKINYKKPVVLFAGVWWETGHAILELVDCLNELGSDIYFIPRLHPGMVDETPEELPLWNDALSKFKSGDFIDTSGFRLDIKDLISASDLVISLFSTVLTEAALLRRPNIAILYPDRGMKVYTRLTGLRYYPMVSLGCSAIAYSRNKLREELTRGLSGSLNFSYAQEKSFVCDGQNAQRAASFIQGLI